MQTLRNLDIGLFSDPPPQSLLFKIQTEFFSDNLPITHFVNLYSGNRSHCQIIKFSNYTKTQDIQYQLGTTPLLVPMIQPKSDPLPQLPLCNTQY